MTSDLSILRVASSMAKHAALRHETLSRNVVNADTPGYKARDVEPFDAMIALKENAQATPFRTMEMTSAEVSMNGNTVSLEEQVLLASQAQMQHQTALGIYRKTVDLLRMGIGRR